MNSIVASAVPTVVRFDFRFDPQLNEHEEKVAIRQKLVHQFAVEHAGEENLEGITLYPVSRAGKSGSEVFYLDLRIKGHGFPERFIAKFQNKDATLEEAASARSAKIGGFCNSFFHRINVQDNLGVIVYNLAAARDHIEFRGFFLDIRNTNEACATALHSIFQTVGRQPNNAVDPKSFIEDYAWYVDRKSKPLQRIDALTVVAQAQGGIGDVASSIRESYQRIERDFNIKVSPYLVHGDLHARNLMLSQSNPAKTELIDFGWVHSGHPAKDFVLMECTLKYMLLPELLPIAKGSASDNLYIPAKFIEGFEQFLCKHGFSLPSVEDMLSSVFGDIEIPAHQVQALSRVYCCLVAVRLAAGDVLKKYCSLDKISNVTPEQHYFASFFLVTVGLLGFAELDQIWAMIGLQTVGANL